MKYNLYIWATLLAIAFSSCEEVIDIEVEDKGPAVVIEANITDKPEKQTVYLSQTIPFDEITTTKGISNAIISIQEEGGPTLNFTEEQPGVYKSIAYNGKYGKNYTLQVQLNGKTYTSVSRMPQKVTLDSISIADLTFFGETNKFVKVHFQDPPQIQNAYNYVITINGKKNNAFYVENDRFSDGNYISNTIFTDEPDIVSGDNIMIDFQAIDQNVYRYFFAVSQIGGNGGPPVAPSNPDSNISNGALGYFSAHTSEKRMFKVK